MITTAIINTAWGLISMVFNFLPQGGTFPEDAHQAMIYLGNYLGILDPLVPINTLGIIVTLVVGVELSIFSFKTIKWIISHIPMVGGRG